MTEALISLTVETGVQMGLVVPLAFRTDAAVRELLTLSMVSGLPWCGLYRSVCPPVTLHFH